MQGLFCCVVCMQASATTCDLQFVILYYSYKTVVDMSLSMLCYFWTSHISFKTVSFYPRPARITHQGLKWWLIRPGLGKSDESIVVIWSKLDVDYQVIMQFDHRSYFQDQKNYSSNKLKSDTITWFTICVHSYFYREQTGWGNFCT